MVGDLTRTSGDAGLLLVAPLSLLPLHVASLDSLTVWWPQSSQTSYLVLASKGNGLSNKTGVVDLCKIWPWKSHRVAVCCSSKPSEASLSSRGEKIYSSSQCEEWPRMCGVATFNPPQRPRLLLGPHSKPGVVVQNLSQGSGSKQAAHPKGCNRRLMTTRFAGVPLG